MYLGELQIFVWVLSFHQGCLQLYTITYIQSTSAFIPILTSLACFAPGPWKHLGECPLQLPYKPRHEPGIRQCCWYFFWLFWVQDADCYHGWLSSGGAWFCKHAGCVCVHALCVYVCVCVCVLVCVCACRHICILACVCVCVCTCTNTSCVNILYVRTYVQA